MSRNVNIVNNIVLLAGTLLGILAVTLVGNDAYPANLGLFILYCVLGAFFWAAVNLAVHEAGHVRAAKKNRFRVLSVRLAFFLFTEENGKRKVSLTGYAGESGYTEMVPEGAEDLAGRFRRITRAGVYGNVAVLAVSVVPLCLTAYLPFWLYSLWAISLPVSLYFVLGNALPMTTDGVKNDAAVAAGVKRGDASEKVALGLLQIHAGLIEGKSPAEIDEALYLDLPQLPEDDLNYLYLLNARYCYYLDKEDYENAKSVSARLKGLLDTMPKCCRPAVRADLLYNACTFDYDESEADNLVEDNEKYLNKTSDVTALRVKAAYVLYVLKDGAQAEKFIARAEELAADCKVAGQRKFEEKLLLKMRADLPAAERGETAPEEEPVV